MASSLARVSFFTRCLGPVASAVMNGRLISVSMVVESSILALSAASRSRCRAISLPLPLRSRPSSFLNSSMSQSTMRWSMLSPPRCVSPLVAFTSMTPSPTSRMEMSKVPPPKSYTAMVSSFFLVQPVGERRRRRLIDDAHHFQAGDFAGVLGGLALRVVEVGGNGDDRLGDLLAEEIFGRGLQLLQDHRGDFRRRVGLALRHHGDVVALARRLYRAPSSSLRSLRCSAGP